MIFLNELLLKVESMFSVDE